MTFVANRVHLIWKPSEASQWSYIELKNSPTDEKSHDVSLSKDWMLVKKSRRWDKESRWPQSKEREVNDISDDPEIKKTPEEDMKIGPNTGFEFGRWYVCIKLLEHHKCQKILQADRSFVFCFIFSLDKYVLL